MFPIGTKRKVFLEKNNISAHLQSRIDEEFNHFYKRVPLKKEPFDEIKQNKTKIKKIKSNKTKKQKP